MQRSVDERRRIPLINFGQMVMCCPLQLSAALHGESTTPREKPPSFSQKNRRSTQIDHDFMICANQQVWMSGISSFLMRFQTTDGALTSLDQL